MRLLVQEVLNSSVSVGGKTVGSIGRGETVLVGFKKGDDEAIVDRMVAKLLKLRIFPDGEGKTNKTLADIDGEILAVSQFTLYASLKDGNRPSFAWAMNQEEARPLFEYFQKKLSSSYPKTAYGIFHADMKVALLNDGPFTVLLDSEELGIHGK